MMHRHQLEERRAQAAVDLAEVGEQRAAGELDEATASTLQSRYQQEIELLDKQLLTSATASVAPPGRSTARLVAGTLIMVAGIIAVVFLAARAIDDRRPGEFVTGNVDDRDLSEITTEEMEQVVADFPNIIDMRLALAGRYFEAADYSAALPHYLKVLEQDPGHPIANANIGWMTYRSDPSAAATAAAFLERSLATAPNFADALFFLSVVRLYGLDDASGARPLIEELLQFEGLPDGLEVELEAMLTDAARG
jgi:tetratricopeptide (TPR) repeat protein